MILLGLGTIVMVAIFYTLYEKSHHGPSAAHAPGMTTHEKASAASLPNSFDGTQTSGEIPAASSPPPGATTAQVDPYSPARPDALNVQASEPLSDHRRGSADTNGWDAYYKALSQQQARVQSQAEKALDAPTVIPVKNHEISRLQGAESMTNPNGTAADGVATRLAAADPAGQGSRAPIEPNGQSEKQAFLNAKPDPNDYLPHRRTAPKTAYDVKAGTVIPAVLISGLNSDLPGQIIAEVRENVYDTATGDFLIVPQGARLVGSYDSKVTYGQSRALTAWHRIIFPDASSVDLDTMPGADQSGYSGFSDVVDNHLVRLIGSAVLLSVFSAGIQLSQPQPSSTSGSSQPYTDQQIIAASLGQQLGALGEEITRKNLDIQPTIEIRPGYLFNVMVTKDLVMDPWETAQ